MSDQALEREIKLTATTGDVDAGRVLELARREGFDAEPAGTVVHDDLYLDTQSFSIARHGAGLRVRDERGDKRLHWKGPAIVEASLHSRVELEAPWTGRPLPETVAELPERFRVEAEPVAQLRELSTVATLSTERRRFELVHRASGGRAELALDRVRATAGASAPVEFRELEIEVREGDAAPWSELADRLQELGDLHPSPSNKLRRTFELAGVAPAGVELPTVLTAKMPLHDAALVIFRRHLTAARREEPGTRLRTHIERLHKMRVATRRLRSAFRTFAGAFPEGALGPWDNLMKRTGRALGPARDLDVLLEAMPDLLGHVPDTLREDLVPFEELLETLREREQAKVLAYLSSRSRLRALERFENFVDDPSAPGTTALRVRQVAPGVILDIARKAFRDGARIGPDSPPEDLHALRITMKKLRYTLECFVDVYGKPLTSFIDSARDLQDILGAYNDASVWAELIQDLVQTKGKRLPKNTLVAIGAIVGVIAERGAEARSHFEETWAEFDRPKTRRKLVEAVSPQW